jgi:outer membrane protein TolC
MAGPLALFIAASLAALPHRTEAQRLTLVDAADSALASHPSVREARARVDGAEAGAAAARAQRLPSLVATSGLTRFEEPMVVAPFHVFDPTNPPTFDRTLLQSQLGLDYTLFDGGVRGARIRGAAAFEAGARDLRSASEMDLLEAVAAAYVSVLAARSVRMASERQVASLGGELTRARQRLREGTTARVEVLRGEAALLDAEAQHATAQARVGLAERTLARLTGLDSVAIRELADVGVRPVGGSEMAEVLDPRVQAARRALDVARARVEQERAHRLPTLRASAGLLSFGSGTGEFVTEWQAGVRVSWPVFTGGARAASIRVAEADLRGAQEQLRAVELAVAGELDAAEAARVEAATRVVALAAAVAQWEEVGRIEALALEAGAGVQQDFLRAEAALFQARAGHARARYDEILAHVGRARAQGRLDRAWMADALEIR